jgi:hypothetical protein
MKKCVLSLLLLTFGFSMAYAIEFAAEPGSATYSIRLVRADYSEDSDKYIFRNYYGYDVNGKLRFEASYFKTYGSPYYRSTYGIYNSKGIRLPSWSPNFDLNNLEFIRLGSNLDSINEKCVVTLTLESSSNTLLKVTKNCQR